MKKIVLIFFSFCFVFFSKAQVAVQLKWDLKLEKINENEYWIAAQTTLPKGWFLYGNNYSQPELPHLEIQTNFEGDSLMGKPIFAAQPTVFKDPIFDNQNLEIYTNEIRFKQKIFFSNLQPAYISGSLKVFIANKENFLEDVFSFELQLPQTQNAASVAAHQNLVFPSIKLSSPINNCVEGQTESAASKSLFSIFLLGFIGGFLALLTPCVFPMIPVTVAFFTKKSTSRKKSIVNGLLYGGFILLIYIGLSLPFHLMDNTNPELFNNIATNPWVNLVFFFIFLFFALSFFGVFNLQLPNSIAGIADSKSNLASLGGIFFMALTLTIVSFSCTGPILGSLLVGTASGGAAALTAGLAGFGLALALPFGLFAIFPHWLKALPKSGNWMTVFKVSLAFIELALAFKFLSNADLVMHWGLLKREVFIVIWMLIALGLTLYLWGIFAQKNTKKNIGWVRRFLSGLGFFCTLYLAAGLFFPQKFSLRFISGFPPPLEYSYAAKNIDQSHLKPKIINDFQAAVALSKSMQKPILIDFTGWACVNCRKMEESVWKDEQVKNLINERFILLSLYVDDKTKLPVAERFLFVSPKDSSRKDIQTIGDKWTSFQAENFDQVTQPLYAVISPDTLLLSTPIGYTPDVQVYLNWLECSLGK